jgi:hypothetical protein
MKEKPRHQAENVPGPQGWGQLTAQLQAYLSICMLNGHMLSQAMRQKRNKTAFCKRNSPRLLLQAQAR